MQVPLDWAAADVRSGLRSACAVVSAGYLTSSSRSMSVLMMKIRIMRMSMPDRRMGVFVRVRFVGRPGEIVLVLMMLIVYMCVSMSQRLVFVFVAVVFGHVEHDADQHQEASEQQARR